MQISLLVKDWSGCISKAPVIIWVIAGPISGETIQTVGCDQTQAVKSREKTPENLFFLLHISSSYTKIWGKTKFQPREFPQSGSKAIEEDRRERKSQLQWSLHIYT